MPRILKDSRAVHERKKISMFEVINDTFDYLKDVKGTQKEHMCNGWGGTALLKYDWT